MYFMPLLPNIIMLLIEVHILIRFLLNIFMPIFIHTKGEQFTNFNCILDLVRAISLDTRNVNIVFKKKKGFHTPRRHNN